MIISKKAAIEAASDAVDRCDGGMNLSRHLCIKEAVEAVPGAKLVIIDHYGDGDATLLMVENYNSSFSAAYDKAVGMWNDSDGDDEFIAYVLERLEEVGYQCVELLFDLYR